MKQRYGLADEPPYLAVGTEVSAKYKGAFCEAKIRKVVRSVKCKVIFKQGLGTVTVTDDQIRGQIRNGVVVEARHPEKKEFFEATIGKVQDCSQYTVVFDDGDITTLRRTALCLKSGRHFAESETLDQLPLTHPEHFSNPVIGGRRGRRNRTGLEESSEDEEAFLLLKDFSDEKEEDIGRVVCVEGAEKKKQKDNWFPGLVVAPTAQDTVPIDTRLEYLVRSFKDGRYYTVPKKEALEFTREIGLKVENSALKAAVEKAYQFLDKDELPPHWDRDSLFGLTENMATDSDAGFDYESSDDEPREEKDHFVAQLYKFMDDSGTPINKGPIIGSQDVDLYRLFKIVQNLGGFNRVTNHNNWKIVSNKMGFGQNPVTTNMVKQTYKKYLYSFEEFYRKLGCTMVNHPRTSRNRNRSNRSLIRDKDKTIKTEPKIEFKDKQDEAPYDSQIIFPTPFIKVEVDESNQETGEPSGNLKQEKSGAAKNILIEEPKVKTEPPDEKDVKCEMKEIKKTPRQKKIRSCLIEQMPDKSDNNKSVNTGKDKKRRLFTRAKREKDKSFVVKKSPIPSGTRQKRIIKDKEKVLADQFKLKQTKMATSVPSLPDTEKMAGSAVILKVLDSSKITVLQSNQQCYGQSERNQEIQDYTPTSKKPKEDYLPSRNKKDDSVPVIIEEKKKGRKRKEKAEVIDESLDTLPTYKTVSVGDKLKVYYGPKHDLKVTYEAKVLNIREEGSEAMYLVHYYGWNTRYDEWIKHSRVADNMSWVPGRPTKKSQQTPKGGRKRSGQGAKNINDGNLKVELDSHVTDQESADPCNDVKLDSVSCPSPPFLDNKLKGTRAITRASNKRVASVSENEDYESDNIDIESVYPKKKANLVVEQDELDVNEKRAKKRKSIDIDEKESKSDDDCDQLQHQKLKRKMIKKVDLIEDLTPEKKVIKECDDIHELSSNTPESNTVSCDTPQKFVGFDGSSDEENFLLIAEDEAEIENIDNKEDNILTEVSDKLKLLSDNPPKGRDFDLNQIRSELKGIETAVSNITPKNEEENIDIDSEGGVNITLKHEVEDVYEFKEPEPFEFESRKIADEKNKLQRRTLNRYFDESKHSPRRKKKNEFTQL